ncbi:MAG: hypothetical protein ACFHHU_11745 [Porticoccaceae bacterium]
MRITTSLLLIALCLTGCGGSSGGGSNTGGNNNPGRNAVDLPDDNALILADSSSPYADDLSNCLNPENESISCTLDTIPLLGQTSSIITPQAVLEKTLVSHQWIAERWEALLPLLPDDLLQLMGSLTGVVIGADIRPSFYTTQSGAMYLDAAFFWLSNAEKADIDTEPDFRSGFGSDLQFITLTRYIRDNDYAWRSYSLNGTDERNLEDLVEPLSSLLFHELGHANDFFPKSSFGSLNNSNSVLSEGDRLASSRVSSALVNFSPLTSELLVDVAQVLFQGATATDPILELATEDVAAEFSVDVANDDYAYTNQFEDLAMLLEEVMMNYHFGIDRDIAYIDRPATESSFCVDYPVRWGQRSRIGDPGVKARARYMLQVMLNQTDVSEYIDDLDEPVPMVNGNDWCQNINLSASPVSAKILYQRAETPNDNATFPESDKRRFH